MGYMLEFVIISVVVAIALGFGGHAYVQERAEKRIRNSKQEPGPILGVVFPRKEDDNA